MCICMYTHAHTYTPLYCQSELLSWYSSSQSKKKLLILTSKILHLTNTQFLLGFLKIFKKKRLRIPFTTFGNLVGLCSYQPQKRPKQSQCFLCSRERWVSVPRERSLFGATDHRHNKSVKFYIVVGKTSVQSLAPTPFSFCSTRSSKLKPRANSPLNLYMLSSNPHLSSIKDTKSLSSR